MSGISVFFKTTTDENLRINGLNRFVRHPLYSGTILFVAGCFLWYPGLANLVSFFCITCYILIGIKYEEKKLIRFIGNDYKNYASNVPMIVPEIFFKKKKQ
jgi:protein-S-isoprenylcysteine O-methyltransferase Ste14